MYKWMQAWMVIVFLSGCLGGCSFLETRTSDRDLRPIDTAAMRRLLAEEPDKVVLVDVRTAARFASQRLPGAINIPLSEMRQADERLAHAQTIVTYSQGWNDYLAPAGAKKLMALGYKHVRDYRGGIEQWKADGQPILTGP